MAAIKRTPESESLEVVIVGSFNPAIFHPEWFLRQAIVPEQDAKEAEVRVVSAEVSDIQMAGLRLTCIAERFSLGTNNISHAAKVQDLLVQIFTLLSHIPVTACGINASVHYLVGDKEYWHKIGHTLAPKELIWNALLQQPGMQSLTIKGVREGAFPGENNLTVEPSALYNPGLFVRSNYHFKVPENKVHSAASQELINFLRSEWNPALGMARCVADRIFENIPQDNG